MPLIRPGQGLLDVAARPHTLPPWLTEHDIDAYVTQYARAGFTGPLNWYRNIDRNWELTAPWQHALIDVPALFIAGDRDPNLRTISPAGIATFLPKLTKSLMLPGCGHWVQQERPTDVTAAMLEFLGGLR